MLITIEAEPKEVWQEALLNLKNESQAYGVLYANAKVDFSKKGKRVKFSFPENALFSIQAAQKPDVLDALKKALSRAGVRPKHIEFCIEAI